MQRQSLFVPAVILMLAACTEPMSAPTSGGTLPAADAVKFWQGNAAVYWNQVAREMVVANRIGAPFAIRGYAAVSVAQYNAAIAAETTPPPGSWNKTAANLAVQYHLGEREAAHVFALMNMVGLDAIIASHDAKFTYWLIRPSQADPGIRLAIGLPDFPSYPSNHSTISAGMAAILGAMFPAEEAGLDALAEEAGPSRILGGIHYSFDNMAGLRLGRTIAAWALERDVKGHDSFTLR